MADDAAADTRQSSAAPAMPTDDSGRLVSLDFIRGVAVLGILGANIVGFAHPLLAYSWPAILPDALGAANESLWLVQYLLIDGKMRGLFTLLFGAGMALFIDRTIARGQSAWLQIRRLLWLMLFGLLHFFLLFWGDILFLYALSGLVVMTLLHLPARSLLRTGIVWYVSGGLLLAMMHAGSASADHAAAAQGQEARTHQTQQGYWETRLEEAEAEADVFANGGFAQQVEFTFEHRASQIWQTPFFALIETIPLMLIGAALFRLGFFSGGIDPGSMRRWGWAGVIAGTGLTLPLGLWGMAAGFPPYLTDFIFNAAPQIPRLPVILGLAALLVCWAPRLSESRIGGRLTAAGRAAFSNYIGTSVLMMLVFRGWAGGYYGQLDRAELLVAVLFGWAAMLAWSKPWLSHFRFGPLEWVWRCLTYWRLFPMRR